MKNPIFVTSLGNSSRELLVGKVKVRIAGQCQCCQLNGKAAVMKQDGLPLMLE